ncbi:uncharacterized protein LOC6579355 isoform X2 [Drosophila mojavensis]|uniref:BACK domain-containing protein n=1 Tax=Drosophila mojavensis TaxID=7230 RepID=B4KQ58_DROMO|nr:uncharacterized protein LOC6579355 isoform X2 [Drosophila mojavensis]EDW09186.2 uncharacterized protein Dmoj_GI20387 [Drosophila mojavensis]
MEDSVIIEDVIEQPSTADCSVDPPAPPAQPAPPASAPPPASSSLPDLQMSSAHIQLSAESSDEPTLEVLWNPSTLIDLESEEYELIRLQSSTELKPNGCNSSKSFTAEMLELHELINEQFPLSETSEDKVVSLESSSDSRMTKTFINQMDIKSTFQPCSSEDSGPDSGITYNSQANSRVNSEERLPLRASHLNENFRLIPLIDMSDDIHYDRKEPERPCYKDQLEPILKAGLKWDVKVFVGIYKFYCFQCVLEVYSPYFRRPKLEDVVQLPSHKVTPRAFHTIYYWMLHEKLQPHKRYSNRYLLEIYSSAKYLGIPEIIEAVWNNLDIIKNENEAFTLMPDLNYMDLTNFEFLCYARISRFFLTLVASHEFIEMELYNVKRLLSNHNAGVNSEIEIFYSAVRWVSYDWPDRVDHVPDLMKCVRFNHLSPIFLRFLQKQHNTRVMQYIANLPYVQDQINKAFIYASAELFCKDPQQTLPFPVPEYEVPEQRRWIYDEKCSYHHDLKCSQRQFITYQQFLSYLESLHETGPDYWRNLVYITEPIKCCTRLMPE